MATSEISAEHVNKLGDERNAALERVRVLEALLREADDVIVWEIHMRNGRRFQRRVEEALGIGKPRG